MPHLARPHSQTVLSRLLGRLALEMAALTPVSLAIFNAPRHLPSAKGTMPEAMQFLAWWAICALARFLLFGAYDDHYTAPLLPPLAVLAAAALGRPGAGRGYTSWLIGKGFIASLGEVPINQHLRGNRADIERVTDLIRPKLGRGCLYLYEGDPILYETTGACIATRYIFPSYLSTTTEADAIGVDPVREVKRIIATQPSVVVLGQKPCGRPPAYKVLAVT